MTEPCTCPPEPPIDDGRAFLLRRDGVWICSRCNGAMRDDQRPQLDETLAIAQQQSGR